MIAHSYFICLNLSTNYFLLFAVTKIFISLVRKVRVRLERAFAFFVCICISDEMRYHVDNHCIYIFYQLITLHFR